MKRDPSSLIDLAWAGFVSLDRARDDLANAAVTVDIDAGTLLELFLRSADPDKALGHLLFLARDDEAIAPIRGNSVHCERLLRVLGASNGLAEFINRHPRHVTDVVTADRLPEKKEFRDELLKSVGAHDGYAADIPPDEAWTMLRVKYRQYLLRIATRDLMFEDPVTMVPEVTDRLSELAGAALEASLCVARTELARSFPQEDVTAVRLAIVGMGKAGAGELNYVSDVDVIFVAGSHHPDMGEGHMLDIATRLAQLTVRGVNAPAAEPALWEVDSNLRPEGRDGALVRTLDSHLAYYERWARSWEFQALLKARPLAGDYKLAEQYVDALSPKVWESAASNNFVSSVQRMRERVTEHIPADDTDRQLKLGPGGLRDVEFAVQLLQLVHGLSDPTLRVRATLPALQALADGGYIGREEATQFGNDYRVLRLLEHRQQLKNLRRTHLMPRADYELRTLARASGLATTAADLVTLWQEIRHRVRGVHERLFYTPLLQAVASLPAADHNLTSTHAAARLAAIGFARPDAAIQNIRALTAGVSRRAVIHRNLLPVLLQWFAEGIDPDFGLLAFRRVSEALRESPWYMRMLRDSSGAAYRLTQLLGNSRFVADLLEIIPDVAVWLANGRELRPRPARVLAEETRALLARHHDPLMATNGLKSARRREILRVAMACILGVCDTIEVGFALSDIGENYVNGLLEVIRRNEGDERNSLEFVIVALGRFGGRELSFGSDADVMYVIRSATLSSDGALLRAKRVATELKRLSVDARLPFDLDLGLRPEGKNGPLVRSFDSYKAYYKRWSLTWEIQALLRARCVAGDKSLIDDFDVFADSVRYPSHIEEGDLREIKRIKARVENERLPQGVDPSRHVKLGKGSLSDVEWLAQFLQLQHGSNREGMRKTSTLDVLEDAQQGGFISAEEHEQLREAWIFVSRVRSAMTLLANTSTDVLPVDRNQLDGIARLVGYKPRSATLFEEDYMRMTRRARTIFEKHFYGQDNSLY